MIEFSVLMSLYFKENPLYLDQCLDSLLKQKLKANEIVIVLDGPITKELNDILVKWEEKLPLRIFPLSTNVGLGAALNYGLDKCCYDLVARMDTDDICHCERFELQISEFKKNPKLVLLGSAISEFDGMISNVLGIRSVPLNHNDILSSAKIRNPFNHMTVVFKKNAIFSVGGYIHHHYMEDYNLWLRLLNKGVLTKNLPDTLVSARSGAAMLSRRRGLHYIKSEYLLAKLKYRLGFLGWSKSINIFLIRCLPRLVPVFILRVVYSILRK
ncbi:glycosyltransferase [Citrobacter werkmanii]|uniref:glycosyltransferase n=1 Tax=Citrobacter werkmanii TaxID=67827 RepID=UPI00300DA97E